MTTSNPIKSITTEVDPAGMVITVEQVDGTTVTESVLTDDLREGGWVLQSEATDMASEVANFSCNHTAPEAVDFGAGALLVMEDWHNDHHPGVFRVCTDTPCTDLIKAMKEH